jgi:Ca-activated chloride channel family protein
MNKILLFLALTLVCFTTAFAQTGLSLHIKENTNHGPVIGAMVQVTGKDTLLKAITDANGVCKMQLRPGNYKVSVTGTGYKSWSRNQVTVTKNKVRNLNVVLIDNAAAMQEVVVSHPEKSDLSKKAQDEWARPKMAKRKEAPASKYVSANGRAAAPASQGYAFMHDLNPNVRYDSRSTPGNYPATPQPSQPIRRQKGSPGQMDTIAPKEYNTEQYDQIVENQFIKPDKTPVSTFSIDVDVASYSNIRRFLNAGQKPPVDAVRIEEMLNYFDYQYAEPQAEHPIEVVTEMGVCPWQPEHHLLLVGLQGRKIDAGQLPPSNLVFLIDVSGSMDEPDRLPLVQQSLHLLTEQLRPQDRVAIVVYAGAAGTVLESTPGSEKAKILAAIDRLKAGGSTAGSAGIKLAYEIAGKNLMPRGNNRVILCTDGDFNVGTSSEAELSKLIEEERATGVYLTVLGYGRGNYQDGKMQALADKGNGNHAYIDQISEARKVLVKEFGSTLFTIAKDVKLQLDFNPAQVAEYRLIGYENRLLNKEDFDDDKKDAGELGAGHHVTALYEIIPNKEKRTDETPGELVKLKFRYKPPTGDQPSRLIERSVKAVCTAQPSENFKLASSVAEFGLLLRDSKYKGSATWNHALDQVRKAAVNDPGGYRAELVGLVEKRGKM